MFFTFFVLLPFAFAASFVSANEGSQSKLDYATIKPKEVLIVELSQSEGIFMESVAEWIDYVLAYEVQVSENAARWVMLSATADETADTIFCQFFFYSVENFGYISLVKDLVDYGGSDHLLKSYLIKHHLDPFTTSIPSILREAVGNIKSARMMESIYLLLKPHISDYTINHPSIRKGLLVSSNGIKAFKVSLICHCLGTVEIDVASIPVNNFANLAVITELSLEFPQPIAKLISEVVKNLNAEQPPPSDEFWQAMLRELNEEANLPYSSQYSQILYYSRYFSNTNRLYGLLLHHLFQNHQVWISERFQDVTPLAKRAYFETFPHDLVNYIKGLHLPASFVEAFHGVSYSVISRQQSTKWAGRVTFKALLVCYCLDLVDMSSRKFRPTSFKDLAIIDEVSHTFPEAVSKWTSTFFPCDLAFLEIYRSGGPPKPEQWNEYLTFFNQHLNVKYFADGLIFNFLFGGNEANGSFAYNRGPLVRDLLHHLFQHHREWIMAHWKELKGDVQAAYLLTNPQDVQVDLLPTEVPFFGAMVPQRSTPRLLPFFRAVAKRYNMIELIAGAIKYNPIPNGILPPMSRNEAARSLIQSIRITDPAFLKILRDESVNYIITAIYYALKGAVHADDEVGWWSYLLLAIDAETWAIPLLHNTNNHQD